MRRHYASNQKFASFVPLASDVATRYGNARPERAYKLDSARMTVEEEKKDVWRDAFAYYDTVRGTTMIDGGFPPSVYDANVPTVKSAA